ncbi:MAG: integrase core domain-containing protein [Actinomycetota bacterium]|nr:integrase core domain-containing protein [Actinomycetota bacterium]
MDVPTQSLLDAPALLYQVSAVIDEQAYVELGAGQMRLGKIRLPQRGARRMKILTVIDEFTREALAIVPARSLTSSAVKGVLAKLFAVRGKPSTIRSDNGPEFVAFELTEWLETQGATTHHIEPGKPWQNSFAESFNSRVRDECLNMNEFWSIEHARVVLESWRIEFNTEHPHSSLGYMTPEQFAASWDAA